MYFKFRHFVIKLLPLFLGMGILGLVTFFKYIFAIQELNRDSFIFDIAYWAVQIIVWGTILFIGYLGFKLIQFLIKKVMIFIR